MALAAAKVRLQGGREKHIEWGYNSMNDVKWN